MKTTTVPTLADFLLHRQHVYNDGVGKLIYGKKKKVLGKGANGIAETVQAKDQLTNRTFDVVRKTSTSKKDMNPDEYFAMLLLTKLVTQGICPHFAFVIESVGPMIYMENIPNPMTLARFAKENHSPAEWTSVLFQLLAALYAMYVHFGMVHTDLHADNILLTPLQKGGYLNYTIKKNDYYVPNLGFFVYIIDLGYIYSRKMKFSMEWYHRDDLKLHKRQQALGGFDTSHIAYILDAAPSSIKKTFQALMEDPKVATLKVIETLFQGSCKWKKDKLAPPCYSSRPTEDVIEFRYDLDKRVIKSRRV